MNPHVLDCCEAVRGLTRDEKQFILSLGQQIAFASNERILEEGSAGGSFYFLISGKASVRRGGRQVAETTAGAILGEMSLFNENIRTSEVTALEPCVLLDIASA